MHPSVPRLCHLGVTVLLLAQFVLLMTVSNSLLRLQTRRARSEMVLGMVLGLLFLWATVRPWGRQRTVHLTLTVVLCVLLLAWDRHRDRQRQRLRRRGAAIPWWLPSLLYLHVGLVLVLMPRSVCTQQHFASTGSGP